MIGEGTNLEVDDSLYNGLMNLVEEAENNNDIPAVEDTTKEVDVIETSKDDLDKPDEIETETETEDVKKDIQSEIEVEEPVEVIDEPEDEGSSFEGITEVLGQYGISEDLTEEQSAELSELSGEDKIEKFLEFQSENKEAKFNDTVYGEVDKIIDSLPEKSRNIIELISKGISEDEAFAMVTDKYSVENISEEKLEDDEDLQRKVISQYLRETGNDAEEIEERLEFYEMKDKLGSMAIKALGKQKEIKAKKITEKEQSVQLKQQEQQQKYNLHRQNVETNIDGIKEIIPGKKLTTNDKKELKESLFKQVKTKDGVYTPIQLARMRDVQGFDIKLAYLEKLGLFKDDPKAWNSILKLGGTKQVNTIINKMKHGSKAAKYTGSKSKQSNTDLLSRAFPNK